MGNKLFKFSTQDSDLEYSSWQCKKSLVSSDFKPPLKDSNSNIIPIMGRFFVNNVGCQSYHFFKTFNRAQSYEKCQIFKL